MATYEERKADIERRLANLPQEASRLYARYTPDDPRYAKARSGAAKFEQYRREALQAELGRVNLRLQAQQRAASKGTEYRDEVRALKRQDARRDYMNLTSEQRRAYDEQRIIVRSEAALNPINRPSERQLSRMSEEQREAYTARQEVARKNVGVAQQRKAYEAAVGREIDWSDPTNTAGRYRRPLRSGSYSKEAMISLVGTDRYQRGRMNIIENQQRAAESAYRRELDERGQAYVSARTGDAFRLSTQGINTAGEYFTAVKDDRQGIMYKAISPTMARRASFFQYDAGTGFDQPKPDFYKLYRQEEAVRISEGQTLSSWVASDPFFRLSKKEKGSYLARNPVKAFGMAEKYISKRFIQPITPTPERAVPVGGRQVATAAALSLPGTPFLGIISKRIAYGKPVSRVESEIQDFGRETYRYVRDKPVSALASYGLGFGTGRIAGYLGTAAKTSSIARAGYLGFQAGGLGVGTYYAGSVGAEAVFTGRPGAVLGREFVPAAAFTSGFFRGSGRVDVAGVADRGRPGIRFEVVDKQRPNWVQRKSFRFNEFGEVVGESVLPGGRFVDTPEGLSYLRGRYRRPYAREIAEGKVEKIEVDYGRGTVLEKYYDPKTFETLTPGKDVFVRIKTRIGKRGSTGGSRQFSVLETVEKPKTGIKPTTASALRRFPAVGGSFGAGYLGFRSVTRTTPITQQRPSLMTGARYKPGVASTFAQTPASLQKPSDRTAGLLLPASLVGLGSATAGLSAVGLSFFTGGGSATGGFEPPTTPRPTGSGGFGREPGVKFGKKGRRRKQTSRSFGYAPDLYSLTFNIKAPKGKKRAPRGGFTGLEIRGL